MPPPADNDLGCARLRVMTVIDSLATGGAETLVCGAARALERRGDTSVVIVVLYHDLSEAWRLLGSGVPVICLEMRDKRDLRRGARRLQAEIAQFAPDVVHAHLFPADWVTALAARAGGSGAAMVLSEHVETNRRRRVPLSRRLDTWIYGHYNHFICVSGMVERALCTWIPGTRGHTSVVANAVAMPTHSWDALGPFASDLIFVGRLYKQKGLDVLIDALAELRSRGMRPTLKVVGEGPRRREYEILVRRRGVREQVRFMGRRQDAQDLMLGARALVMPSRFEGLSMVLLEAMSLGMPVIATAVSGASEVLEHGSSGYLVPPQDKEALADAIATVLLDPGWAARVGANARETVARSLAMSAYAGRLRAVYEQAAARREQSPPAVTFAGR